MLRVDRRLLFLIAQVPPGPAECKHLTNSCWPGEAAEEALTSVSFLLFFSLFGAPQGTNWNSSASVFHSAKGRCSRTVPSVCTSIDEHAVLGHLSKWNKLYWFLLLFFAFLAWIEYWTGSFDENLFRLLNEWVTCIPEVVFNQEEQL